MFKDGDVDSAGYSAEITRTGPYYTERNQARTGLCSQKFTLLKFPDMGILIKRLRS